MPPSFDADALRLARPMGWGAVDAGREVARRAVGRRRILGRKDAAAELRSPSMFPGPRTVDAASQATAASAGHAQDLALVQRVLGADAAALEVLRQRLARLPAMVRHQDARLGRTLNETELEDVVRETVAALWSKLSTFEGRASLETWMYRFASLELLKAVQRKCRAPEPLEDPWSTPDRPSVGHSCTAPMRDATGFSTRRVAR